MDPLTLMAVAQAGISAVGSIVSGFGQFQASRARAAALQRAAQQARGEAAMAAQLATDEGERAAAAAAVQGAASGGGFGGSFAGVLDGIERTAMFNARSAIWSGQQEANNRIYESKVAKQEGNYALLSSVFQAGSSIAGGYMAQAQQKKTQAAQARLYGMGG